MNGIASVSGQSLRGDSSEKELRKPGSIGLHVGELDTAIANLEKMIASHENTLKPILAAVPPNDEGRTETDGSQTDLGRVLVGFAMRVRMAHDHLRRINSRVEL